MSHNPGHVQDVPADATPALEKSLETLVDGSQDHGIGTRTGDEPERDVPVEDSMKNHADCIHTRHPSQAKSWISYLWPSEETFDKLFASEHLGNFVIDRATGKKQFESMPLYVRVGMHLLFCNAKGFTNYASMEHLLIAQSEKQGKMYDAEGPTVLPHIQSFVKTYNLPLDELLVEDLKEYPTFNAFFARRLKPTARPIASLDDKRVITSPADCRLTVWDSVDAAKKIWVKGKQFSVPELLNHDDKFKVLADDPACLLAIARLAPQDYHRFHSPVDAVVGEVINVPGQLYTVNPQAINEDLNVFTMNKRSVMMLNADLGPGQTSVPMAFVAVGAMLVGSIGWSKKPGDRVRKGEELGWFQYGGSTTILVVPSSAGVVFDEDLREHSQAGVEMVVRVGVQIARVGDGAKA